MIFSVGFPPAAQKRDRRKRSSTGSHYWIPLLLSSTVLLRWRNRWTIEIEFFKYFSFTLMTIGYLALFP